MLESNKNNILLILMVLLLAACGSSAKRYSRPQHSINKTIVIQTAKSQLGVNYKFGGSSPHEGFDCSGLVHYSFLRAGATLPRTAYEQYKFSRPVKMPQLKKGDLVFFRIYRSRISHVGIYLGKNRFIHAPSTGKTVAIARLDTPYWRKRFIRAGRIL